MSSVSAIADAGFDYSLLDKAGGAGSAPGGAADFTSSFALSIAKLRSQTLASLTGTAADSGSAGRSASPLAASGAASAPLSTLAADGRNPALFDPESAYKMMSVINKADATWKAQFSELSQMKDSVASLEKEAQDLGDGVDAATGDGSIETQLQTFADEYNAWVRRFDADMQNGGLLAGTQAAQVARYELDQGVKNIFNGAKDGLHGLGDLGLTIDPATGLASLDGGRLKAALAADRQGVADAIDEFSANFAKSAKLLDAEGNFIQNRLANLDGAIHFIADNKASLQGEFGTGDAARPSGQVAQALAAYNRVHGI